MVATSDPTVVTNNVTILPFLSSKAATACDPGGRMLTAAIRLAIKKYEILRSTRTRLAARPTDTSLERVLINRDRSHSPINVRFAPTSGGKADVPGDPSRAKPGSGLCLLDHLVRTGEKGCRNLDTEQFRCLEIDGKQEFGGLLRSLEVCGLTGQINPTRIIR